MFLCTVFCAAQESKVSSVRVAKKIGHTYMSSILKVDETDNNPFIAFSIRIDGNNILESIKSVHYKDVKNVWRLFTVQENNFEPDKWHGLTYLDVGIEETQVKITFKQSTVIDSINFNLYYPYKTEFLKREAEKKNKDIEIIETKTLASCNCVSPTVITRSAWCPNNNCPPNSNPTSTDVKFLIVHHTAGANSSSDWAAVVRSIWDYHVNTNGWSDIGYNFLLDKNGNVYEGRADDTQGAHFSGANSGTSGISLMGNYNSVEPTTVMIDSLNNLLAWKSCKKNIDPTATAFHASSGLNLKTISGHRDGPKATDCPGHLAYNKLPTIRTGVKELVDNCNALSVDDEWFNSLKIYPNPFSEKIIIDTSLLINESVKINCYDVTGRLVFKHDKILKNSKTEVDLSFLSTGVYLLRLTFDGNTTYYKLIKS